jgi:hypothetical protein
VGVGRRSFLASLSAVVIAKFIRVPTVFDSAPTPIEYRYLTSNVYGPGPERFLTEQMLIDCCPNLGAPSKHIVISAEMLERWREDARGL